ncbi:MAG: polysaccharide export protein [Caulobacteraceae bacterium]|nr:polysaccharide export protein [Caulobacteraceae bacterium]
MRPGPLARLAAILLSATVLAGCGHSELYAPELKPTAQFPRVDYATWNDDEPDYRVYPGDELEVQIPTAPELNKTVTVQPDGRVSLPLIAPVLVADRSVVDAEALISTAYAGELLHPQVTITVRASPLKVFVGGEVDKPGVYDMPGDINALQAVIMAGGFKLSAKRSQVVLIRRGAAGRPMMRTVDLRSAIGDPGHVDMAPLRRFDIVYVPKTGVSATGDVVQQYIRDILPVSMGFSYSATGLSTF